MDVPTGGKPTMGEKNYWYAVLENAEDDWFHGSIDLEEAMRICRESGPEAFIAVIDDFTDRFHPYCVRYITQMEFENGMEIKEDRRVIS